MQYRKIAAVAGSALMAGLTLAGAAIAAKNVGDVMSLAKPSDSTENFPLFVVGKDAKTSDVAGALNIAVRMAGESSSTTGTTTTTTTADGLDYHVEVGHGLTDAIQLRESGFTAGSAKNNLLISPTGKGGDKTATFLKFGTITISSVDYKWGEYINVTSTANVNATWDTVPSNAQDKYKEAVMEVRSVTQGFGTSGGRSMSLQYFLKFDRDIPAGTTGSTNTGLLTQKVYWLGKEMVVTKVDLTSSTREINLGETAALTTLTTLSGSDSVKVGDNTVTLVSAGTTSATVKVTDAAGVAKSDSVNEGETKTINGVDINLVAADTESAGTTGSVGKASFLAAGTLATVKIKDGEVFSGNWYGLIDNTSTGLTRAGIYYNYVHTSTNELKAGNKISSPSDYFVMQFDKLAQYKGTDTDKITLQLLAGQSISVGGTNYQVVQIKEKAATTIFSISATSGSSYTDKVWLRPNAGAAGIGGTGTWYWYNTSNNYEALTAAPSIVYTDKAMGGGTVTNSIVYTNQSIGSTTNGFGMINITEPTLATGSQSSGIVVQYNNATNGIFNLTGGLVAVPEDGGNMDAEAYVAYHVSNTGPTYWIAESGNSYVRTNFITSYGSKILSASSSQIEIEIPKYQRGLRLIVGKPEGSNVTTGGTLSVVKVTSDIAKLDTEITDAEKKAKDVVVVGGPCVNTIAAELLNKTYPACGDASGLTKDTAIIQVFNDKYAVGKVAVLVAGWEAADSDAAARALQGGVVTQAKDKVTVTGGSKAVSELTIA